jgi:hypothetical protein
MNDGAHDKRYKLFYCSLLHSFILYGIRRVCGIIWVSVRQYFVDLTGDCQIESGPAIQAKAESSTIHKQLLLLHLIRIGN